jgi:hypothetical protein
MTVERIRIDEDNHTVATNTAAAGALAGTAAPTPLSATDRKRRQQQSARQSQLMHLQPQRWLDELQQCIDQDEHNSPFLDAIKQSVHARDERGA